MQRVFPNEAELFQHCNNNRKSESHFLGQGKAETLANDTNFLRQFLKLIKSTNYLQCKTLPEEVAEAFMMLMCERTYLIQLVRGLIAKVFWITEGSNEDTRKSKA